MQKIHIAYLLALTLSMIRAASQYNFKLASSSLSWEQPLALMGQSTIWIGIVLYILSFPMLLKLYKMLPISQVFPLLSTTLIWKTLVGVFLLAEQVDIYRIIGIGLIMIGSIVVGTSQRTGHIGNSVEAKS